MSVVGLGTQMAAYSGYFPQARDIQIKQHVKDASAREETIKALRAALERQQKEHEHVLDLTDAAGHVAIERWNQLREENEKLKAEVALMQQKLSEFVAKAAQCGPSTRGEAL